MLIDSVIYCGEKELYQARLEYLAPVVDKFIVIESKTYHNGMPRSDYTFEDDFKNNPYRDRIVYKLIDCNDCFQLKEYINYNGGKTFARENYQRNYVVNVLKEFGPFQQVDKVTICDVDEIPSVEYLQSVKNTTCLSNNKPFVFMGMSMFYYNHTVMFEQEFYQPIIAHINYVLSCPNISKQMRKTLYNNVFAHNTGWHLSYFMPTNKIIEKISHFLHNEWYNDANYKNEEWINEQIRNKKSIFNNRGDIIITPSVNSIPDLFLKLENFGI